MIASIQTNVKYGVPRMPRKSETPSLADMSAAPGGAAAVDRALSLLNVFRSGDAALGLSELAQRTSMYKSTILRLTASLEHAGFLQRQDDGRYALGAAVARLNAIYTASFSLENVVMPVLRQLVKRTGESAAYHVVQGPPPMQSRLCLYRVDSPHPIRDHIKAGDLLPLDRGAGGRVLLAFGEHKPGNLSAKSRKLLALVREQGYFAGIGDRQDEVAGISAPVFHADGRLAAALTLTMPAHRYTDLHVKPLLEAARELGPQLL